MKKNLWALLLAMLLLAGCGTPEPTEPTEPPLIEVEIPYETQIASLKYEGLELRLQSIWTQKDPQARILTDAAALFEKQTGAKVTIFWKEEEIAGNTDIFQVSAADFSQMSAEFTMDLTDMAQAAEYDQKSHETLRQQIIDQLGYLGAVAQVPYLGGVYYNTEVFEHCGIAQLPTTWEEFLTLCQTLREGGWEPLTLDQDDTLAAMELHLRRAIGTEEVQRLMIKGNRWDTNLPAIDALEQVVSFVYDDNLSTDSPASGVEGQNKMALSNSAMMVGTNADCVAVEEATLMDLDWGIFPYPGAKGSGTYMMADMLGIHADCPNGQAAFDFVMLLVSGEFDQLRADISQGIPADPDNASPIAGAMEAIKAAQPEPLRHFGSKQKDAAVKLWSGYYSKAGRYASLLELSK